MKNNQKDREEPDSGQSKDNPPVFGKRWVCPQAGDRFIIHGMLVGKLKSLILWFRAFDVSSDSTAVTPETDGVQLDSNFSSRCMASPAGVNDVMLLMRGISFLSFRSLNDIFPIQWTGRTLSVRFFAYLFSLVCTAACIRCNNSCCVTVLWSCPWPATRSPMSGPRSFF